MIIMVRDPWVQMHSRAKAANKSMGESRIRYRQDYRAAFALVRRWDLEFVLVPYECLMANGSPERILGMWGLAPYLKPLEVQGNPTVIRNENEKWYAGLQ